MTFQRMQRQDGFGLMELVIAMTVLVFGIMGIVAAFSAGVISLQRASRASNAATVADAQMEAYRALSYSAIKLNGSTIPTVAPYTTDPACGGGCAAANQVTGGTAACASSAIRTDTQCASRTTIAADQESYRVDTYIKLDCGGGSGIPPGCSGSRSIKLVTIVVRNPATAKVLFHESSTFDALTAGE
jgi:type II secretory pathway pseudopilin PulG